jgi:hypothetical protein
MSKSEVLMDLAKRCEAATGPDHELDALIWCEVFAPADAYVKQSPFNGAWCIYHGVSFRDPNKPRLWEAEGSRVLPVTASLDAALTLVPASLRNTAMVLFCQPAKAGFERDGIFTYFEAATPALALTAAALRAHASLDTPRSS